MTPNQINICTSRSRQLNCLNRLNWRPLGKKGFFVALAICFSGLLNAQDDDQKPGYKDLSLPFSERAADLVSRMTLGEKASQLVNDAPAIPHLDIREYNWWNEGLHGVASLGDATVFPQAVGMAATWNEALFYEVASVISTEFRSKHLAEQHRFGGSDWFGGLTVWSPNINIFRDPRWGRGQETYGEDPYLTSRLGVAFVRGLQGKEGRYLKTIATPKHYAVHSGPEANRHREDVHPSPRDLEETYLPAFYATIVEAKAQSIMCAYNAVDGVPACGNAELLNQRLREQWDFAGYIVSDCDAVGDIYKADNHGYTETPPQAAALAFKSGLDLICGPAIESQHILQAIEQGLLSEAEIDVSLRRLFTARMQLGQFDPPHQVFPKIGPQDYDTPENRQLALQMAEESLVLLKNQDQLLPLKSAPKHIAVIGPNADSIDALVGNYNGSPSHPVTILAGIKQRFNRSKVTYVPGSELLEPYQSPVPKSAFCVDIQCNTQGLRAEYFTSHQVDSPVSASAIVDSAALQWTGELKHGAVRFSGFLNAPETGSYTFRYDANGGYRIWIDGTQVIDAWGVDWRATTASGRIEMEAGKRYSIRVEAFQRQREGNESLVWSKPSDAGGQNAFEAAKNADLVVFVAGLTAQLEGEEIPVAVPGFSGGDRTSLDLPVVQENLLKRVASAGKPLVLVLMNGSALSVNWAEQHIAAIIEAWYPGGQGGEAVANLIAGDFSPAGRLPVTFYKSVKDLPPFNDYAMTNRTYRYFKDEVLYPFGYGLSYTQFSYDDVQVTPSIKASSEDRVVITAKVANTGKMDGDEVVQVYLSRRDIPGSPIRSLVAFKRVHIPKGRSVEVEFELGFQQLSSVNEVGKRELLPGEISIWIGGGQEQTRQGLPPAAGASRRIQVR